MAKKRRYSSAMRAISDELYIISAVVVKWGGKNERYLRKLMNEKHNDVLFFENVFS